MLNSSVKLDIKLDHHIYYLECNFLPCHSVEAILNEILWKVCIFNLSKCFAWLIELYSFTVGCSLFVRLGLYSVKLNCAVFQSVTVLGMLL